MCYALLPQTRASSPRFRFELKLLSKCKIPMTEGSAMKWPPDHVIAAGRRAVVLQAGLAHWQTGNTPSRLTVTAFRRFCHRFVSVAVPRSGCRSACRKLFCLPIKVLRSSFFTGLAVLSVLGPSPSTSFIYTPVGRASCPPQDIVTSVPSN